MGEPGTMTNGANRPLTGWKAIADYFGKDERTVRRWAAHKDMPVRRVKGGQRGAVFAYATDLDRWLSGRAEIMLGATEPGPDTPPVPSLPQAGRRQIGVATLALACVSSLALGITVAGALFWRDNAHPPTWMAESKVSSAESFYLDGLFHLEARNADGIARALGLFSQAIAADPNFAKAYVGMADAYNLVSQYTPAEAGETYPKAKAAAERAIALDPHNASAHAALAFNAFYYGRDIERATSLFREAIRLDPTNAQAHHWYALVAMQNRQFDVARAEIAIAQRLDPRAPAILANKGLILFHAGQTQAALDILRPLAETKPSLLSPHAYLATIYLAQGRETDFLREYRIAAELSGNVPGMAIAAVAEQGLDAGGRDGMLTAMFVEQRRLHAQGRESAFKLALTAAMLGDEGAALDLLAQSLRRGEPDILGIRLEPALASLREDGRYVALVAEAGFAPMQATVRW